MRPIANTVTDRRALQRVEQLLDNVKPLYPARDPHPPTPAVAAVAQQVSARVSEQVARLKGRAEGMALGPEGLRLELAKSLARVAHDGQLRKDGEPYVNHLDRVAGRLPTVRLRTVAWLHDVLEDTHILTADLMAFFPRDIVADVMALTRRKGETYDEFITRTIDAGSDGALQVKLADLADNLSTLDAAGLSGLRARYMRADVSIRNEIKRRIERFERRYGS